MKNLARHLFQSTTVFHVQTASGKGTRVEKLVTDFNILSCKPNAQGHLGTSGLETDKHMWSLPSLVTKETRLQVLQRKYLRNIYRTSTSLCKMKVRDDQMCPYYNDVVD